MASLRALVCVVISLLIAACAGLASPPSSEAKASLAPTGKLRVGVYLGNPISAVRDPATNELRGAGLELGRRMAGRMGLAAEPVPYPSIGALVEGGKAGQWDVAFFQPNPARANLFDFTAPILEVELGYLVAPGSRLAHAAEVDTAGFRIAIQDRSQADALLAGQLKHATLVRVGGIAAAMEALKAGRADAIGTVKPTLHEISTQLPGSRVLEGRFSQEPIVMAVPKGREAGAAWARRFVEEAKAEGLVAAAVERSGASGALVAPAQVNH